MTKQPGTDERSCSTTRTGAILARRALLVLLGLLLTVGCAQPPSIVNTTRAVIAPPPSTSTTSSITEPTTSSITALTTSSASAPTTTTNSVPNGVLQVHFIDVGQGDAILIQTPDGKTALIDGGESDSGVLSYLQAKGVKRIDLMVATHPHADHIGGLTDVLNALPVGEVVTNGQASTTRTYERFLDAIAAARARYTEVKSGDRLKLGSLTLEVLGPVGPSGDNQNEQSVVLRLVHGTVAFLFTGDAERGAEAGILGGGQETQAQVLKVGHHGSRSSSSPAFLAAIQPQLAIYSSGAGNSYGHPHAETLAALNEAGATIYGTDVNGTVVVTSDGTDFTVETTNEGQPRGPPRTVLEQPLVPTSGPLSIAVVSLTSPVSPGATARLTIKTTPGAACTITVYYKSGPSQAAGLGPQSAGSDGAATWRWKVGTRTTRGVWRIVVTAGGGGEETSLELPLEVR